MTNMALSSLWHHPLQPLHRPQLHIRSTLQLVLVSTRPPVFLLARHSQAHPTHVLVPCPQHHASRHCRKQNPLQSLDTNPTVPTLPSHLAIRALRLHRAPHIPCLLPLAAHPGHHISFLTPAHLPSPTLILTSRHLSMSTAAALLPPPHQHLGLQLVRGSHLSVAPALHSHVSAMHF